MVSHACRSALKQMQLNRLQQVAQPYNVRDYGKSAIVFSPHQDDETLGCGGTMIQKVQSGATVKIVYLTDGSGANAHLNLIDPKDLCQIREAEAIEAAQVLGITPDDVLFLQFPDGRLRHHTATATDRVTEILQREQPEEIFIPYHLEPNFIPDHPATNRIVKAALKQSGIPATVYEYPIWFWYHYPWVNLIDDPAFPPLKGLSRLKALLGAIGWALWAGYRLRQDFRCVVDITAVAQQKRDALYEHESQMTAFLNDPRWKTVEDVSHGEFLACCLQQQEFFHRYRTP